MRRFAVVSAIAATKVTPLVEAHGHRVSGIEKLPLVIDMKDVTKTKDAIKILKAVNAY